VIDAGIQRLALRLETALRNDAPAARSLLSAVLGQVVIERTAAGEGVGVRHPPAKSLRPPAE
jgi:hypothetical protein